MNNILEVKNLTVRFGEEKVIDNLSFNLREKENLVIVGPNGAGKTVLLRSLLGMHKIEGEIKWKKDLKIGCVPQNIFIEKSIPLTVEEFLRFKKINIEKTKELSRLVGLKDEIFKKRLGEISSGQIQRVLIVWSLIDNPQVILFDEPTAGVDIEGEETIYHLLAKIEKERDITIILITHDLNVVYRFANTVLCLNKKMVCYGAPQIALSPESLSELYGGEVNFYKHDH